MTLIPTNIPRVPLANVPAKPRDKNPGNQQIERVAKWRCIYEWFERGAWYRKDCLHYVDSHFSRDDQMRIALVAASIEMEVPEELIRAGYISHVTRKVQMKS